MKNLTARKLNFVGFIVCSGLIAFALFMQYVMNIQPCPLCIIERIFVALIGLNMIVAVLHNPGEVGDKIYGIMTLAIAIVGMCAAGRHIWLQNQPLTLGQICVPGLNYLFTNLPITEALRTLVVGTADCAKVNWSFLGLSMPMWTFLFYDLFALLGFIQVIGLTKSKKNVPVNA